MECTLLEEESSIEFRSKDEEVMKITENGISFNREHSALKTADDFAREVIDILEKKFKVKFKGVE